MESQDSGSVPWTVARLLAWTRGYFAERGLDEPRLAAELLLAETLKCPRIALYTHGERVPDDNALTTFRQWVKRAAEHEPVAYLTGRKEFFSLEFEVSPEVLIPRPETEALVEGVLDHCRKYPQPRFDILDMGTGSGCIAVAILAHLSTAYVVATDISEAALRIAESNARRHGVSERFRPVHADALDLPVEVVPPDGFDILVSNPPYVGEDEVASLPRAVRDYEPRLALTDGCDGLGFYRRIAEGAAHVLKPEGWVFVEIAAGKREAVEGVFRSSSRYEYRGTWRARSDPHDRVLGFALQGSAGCRMEAATTDMIR